jgi:EmrB/QacA subfamily drug resistance transporter
MQTDLSTRTKAIIVAGTMLGLFVSAISGTVVSTAMPRIVAHLGGLHLYSWVFTSFMLASTSVIPIVGKLSDLYGRKPFFMGGIIIYMIGAGLCGASQSMVQLIIFRGIQGVGGGAIAAGAFAVVGDLFPPAERGKYAGLFTAVWGLASVVGPTVGGFITDNLSWRWVFYVNLPFGLLALLVLAWGMPWGRPRGRQQEVDYRGVVAMVLAVVPMLLAFVWAGDQYAWGSAQIVGLLGFSTLMIAVFSRVESRAADPILPLHLFRNRIFVVSAVVVFLTGMGMFGSTTYLPLFVQGVIGASATNSGLVITPMMVGMVAASAVSGQFISRVGRYRLLGALGVAVMAFGMFLLSRMDAASTQAEAVRNMVVVGVGLGITLPIFTIAVQNAVPFRLLGVVTSSTQFFRQVGGLMGVAIFGTLMNTHIRNNLAGELPAEVRSAAPEPLLKPLEDPQVLLSSQAMDRLRDAFADLGSEGPRLFEATIGSMRSVLADALALVFFAGVAILVAALAASVFLKEIPLKGAMERALEEVEELKALAEQAGAGQG